MCGGVHVCGNKFPLTVVYVIRNGAQSFLNSFLSTIASNNFKNKRVYILFCSSPSRGNAFVRCAELCYLRGLSRSQWTLQQWEQWMQCHKVVGEAHPDPRCGVYDLHSASSSHCQPCTSPHGGTSSSVLPSEAFPKKIGAVGIFGGKTSRPGGGVLVGGSWSQLGHVLHVPQLPPGLLGPQNLGMWRQSSVSSAFPSFPRRNRELPRLYVGVICAGRIGPSVIDSDAGIAFATSHLAA